MTTIMMFSVYKTQLAVMNGKPDRNQQCILVATERYGIGGKMLIAAYQFTPATDQQNKGKKEKQKNQLLTLKSG